MRTGVLVLTLFIIMMTGTQCEESRAYSVSPKATSPEAEKLGKAIVAAICADNYSAYTELLVTQREYVTVMKSSSDPEDQEKANDSIRGMQKVYRTARQSFDRIRKEATHDGIVWEKAQYKSCWYSIDTIDRVEVIQLNIVMAFRGAEYPFSASEVVRTKSGWKVLGRLYYGDRSAYDMARMMMDSINAADSMMMVEMMHQYDSVRTADSTAWVRERRLNDSMRIADSLAASNLRKKGKKKK